MTAAPWAQWPLAATYAEAMTEPSGQTRTPLPVGDTVGFVVTALVAAIAAFVASFLGRFLSFGATGTTLGTGAVNAVMSLAVAGPFVLWRLSRRTISWPLPLAAVVLMVVNYVVCAALIGS